MTMHAKSYAKAKLAYKKAQGSKESPKLTKVVSFYNDSYSFRQYPVSETFIENLAIEWTNFARNDTSVVRFDDFYHFKGITEKVMLEWCEKFPSLKAAKEIVKGLIANHRERGAIFRDGKMNDKALFMMRAYDSNWQAVEDQKAAASKQDNAPGTITIQMQSFPDVPSVPKKEIVDE